MSSFQPTLFLRRVLLLDAVLSAGAGVTLVTMSGFVAPWLGLPTALLFWTGFSFLPFAAIVAVLATRPTPPAAAILAVAAWNALFGLDCILALLLGWIEPSTVGTVLVIAQGAIVLLFADLEALGVLRARTASAA
jgi:hypothetical protein